MWRDIRYAIQGLWKAPVFTVATTLALGIAIGANATIFGLIDGLWFRPPGVSDPARLAWVFSTTSTEQDGIWSYPEYVDLRDKTTSFDGLVARGGRGTIMPAADGTPELLPVNVVTTNFFTTLGIAAQYGRVFGPGDEPSLEADPGIVLGHAFWLRRFGGDPGIVGQHVQLMRSGPISVRVLAVLPATFRDLDAAADRDIWMPTQTWTRLTNPREFTDRGMRWFHVLGYRRSGTDVGTADAEIATFARALASTYPATNAGRGARVVSDFRYRLASGGVNAAALLGLVLLVVLITCVNVANLLLARGAARTRELAVRSALGASRQRLMRLLLTESAMLGGAGAIAGVTLSLWLIRLLPALLGAPPGFHSSLVFRADSRVFLFTLAITLLTTILFGVVPSLWTARTDVVPLIKEGGGGTRPQRVSAWLATVQIAVSLVLLCGAGVLARSFIETKRADIGLTRSPVLTAWITNDVSQPSGEEAMRRIAALPGVLDTAIAFRAPLSLSGNGFARSLFFPDRAAEMAAGLPEVKCNAVTASYFSVMGTRLLHGRLFTSADERGGELAMIVSEQFAHAFFPGADPVGRQVRVGGAAAPLHRIVGVVQNAAINDIGERPEPYFYLPYWRGEYGEATVLLRTSVPPGGLVAAVRDTLKRLDPALEPRRLITMRDYMDYSGSTYRSTAVLAATLGMIGLVLTVLGVYGVIAYRTARRTREIGIRMALGAHPREVLGLVLREGIMAGLVGLAIGIPAALVATRFIASMLFNVDPWDGVAFTVAAALLLASVCAAAAVPAWRATRVSPATALRDA